MPYILCPPITTDSPGLWREGNAYEKEIIYDINSTDATKPPVHYLKHTFKPHSLCHIDAPAHTLKKGKTIDAFFAAKELSRFYGQAVVAKIPVSEWLSAGPGLFKYEVSVAELKSAVAAATGKTDAPDRILIAPDNTPNDSRGLHDPNYAFTLSTEAANYLDANKNFKLYGTSWKSTDFQPSSRLRPIHEIIFRKGLIMECLDLAAVPAGQYFLVALPLPILGASESLVCPALFTKDELFANT